MRDGKIPLKTIIHEKTKEQDNCGVVHSTLLFTFTFVASLSLYWLGRQKGKNIIPCNLVFLYDPIDDIFIRLSILA